MEKRDYGAHEALTLGIELERDGHAFYSRVARAALEFRVRELFDNLAKAEIQHLSIIEKEIEPLFPPEWYRDEDQQLMAEYLKNMEKQRIFPQPEEAERFARTDLPGAVEVGIRAEELSIEYYGRLTRATETGRGKEAFERLRKEEERRAKEALSGVEATRIPGFCAFNLAGQALLLLSMISLRIVMMEKASDRPELMMTMANLRKVIEQTEPHLKQTFEEMRPWGSLDARTIAKAIASRPSCKRPS